MGIKNFKLRPCPFCGSYDSSIYSVRTKDDTLGIFCNVCKQTVTLEENEQEGDTAESLERAVRAWNERKDSLRKRGTWKPYDAYECTSCGAMFPKDDITLRGGDLPNFCPECGADMRREE